MGEEGQADATVERIRELTAEIDEAVARHLADLQVKAAERAALLRQLHEQQGWSMRRIAEEVGLSFPRVQQILAGGP
jgi:predicted transcriptional regulator